MISRRELLRSGASLAALGVVPREWLERLTNAGAGTDRPYLDMARRAEQWIRRSAIREGNGVTWPWDPEVDKKVVTSLYTGMPGVVLFYLELHHATNDATYLDEAIAGARWLAAKLPDEITDGNAGLYTGIGGSAYVLELVHRASRQAEFRAASERALALVTRAAKVEGDGARWNNSTDIISGSAGIGLFLLWAREHLGADSLALSQQVGRALVAAGKSERGGLKWAMDPTFPRTMPNFSHGTGGVAYYLATLAGVTRDSSFLDAAISGATYLDAIAERTRSDGRRVFHSEPGNETLYYLSWCHGPAGTARLFHRLSLVAPDERWSNYVQQLARGTEDSRVPERSPGFWNNVSQCCGNCGVSDFYLALHGVTKEERWLERARMVMADTLMRASKDGDGVKWVQAEHRVRPELLIAQTGLMQGAAGVGLSLLRVDGVLEKRKRLVVLPDDPFGAA
jgi:lantibiotic modifying enzyme